MNGIFAKYVIRRSAMLMVLVIVTSLFWCADEDAASPARDRRCATILGSPSTEQGSPMHHHSDDASRDCKCICHVPTIIRVPTDSGSQLTPQLVSFEISESPLLSPARSIYRPPKA